MSATPGEYELKKTQGEFAEQLIRQQALLDPVIEVRSAEFQVDDLLVEVKKEIKKNSRVLVTTLTKISRRVNNLLQSLGPKVNIYIVILIQLNELKLFAT